MRRRQILVRRTFSGEVKEAAVQRYLTSDLTLTAAAEEFGASRYCLAAWLRRAEAKVEDEQEDETTARGSGRSDGQA